jgi:hypothetical protein
MEADIPFQKKKEYALVASTTHQLSPTTLAIGVSHHLTQPTTSIPGAPCTLEAQVPSTPKNSLLRDAYLRQTMEDGHPYYFIAMNNM